jgi:hypothetical protein
MRCTAQYIIIVAGTALSLAVTSSSASTMVKQPKLPHAKTHQSAPRESAVQRCIREDDSRYRGCNGNNDLACIAAYKACMTAASQIP